MSQQLLEKQQPTRTSTPPSARPRRTRMTRNRWMAAGAVLLIALAAIGWKLLAKPAAPAFETARAERGDVARSITATGKLQALTTVEVGTQVSGTVSEILVDFNDQVRKGQVIARLDQSQLQAQLTQAQANLTAAQMGVQTGEAALAAAEAGVQAAVANVERLESVVNDARINFERTQELVNSRVGARRELEMAQAALSQAQAQRQQGIAQVNQARAQAQSARSQIAQSRAQVAQAGAAVQLASVNLQKSVITAPIDGVIVARNVNVGQTVAASLQAPVLFLIANDLTRMQVLADIDEADVGQLKQGTPVSFTVDAFPRDNFEGSISQVRLSPQMLQNVVTYTAVVDVANPDQKLKPGMTANISATVEKREDVLTVPNAALRFRPASAEPEAGANTKARRAGGPSVYVVEGQELKQVPLKLGLSNGIVTEVTGGALQEGATVAVPAQTAGARGAAPQASPFGMRPRGGGRR